MMYWEDGILCGERLSDLACPKCGERLDPLILKNRGIKRRRRRRKVENATRKGEANERENSMGSL